MSTCIALFVLVIGMGRGSLSSGSPLRWGDAYKFDHNFANHLALNGTKTFIKSIVSELHNDDRDQWLAAIPNAVALDHVRKQIVLPGEQLVDVATAPIRRITTSKPRLENAVDNIVIILLESFSGQFIGALGNTRNVTPYFDELSKKGVLFTRFFSNGSHTHQGIFATLSCFPNLPGYEYLMQQPQGRNQFSGITAILGPDLVEDLFIYNGDFRWDNQAGFFKNQGMDHFIGCQDFVSPMLMSDTWGVSDEDMFIRATHELRRLFTGRPFFVVLQTLTNHPPYTLPDPLPFEAVMDDGERSERLTAMKYSDWALGKFFESIENDSFFDHTVFAILGDHGFGTDRQLTDINLLRFHVPLLIIAPNIHESYGNRNTTVGSQVDVIPTLVSMVSGRFQHQCWGRNLFAVPESQGGFAIIKPSGGEPIVAILRDDKILTYDHERESQLFTYGLNQSGTVAPLIDRQIEQDMKTDLLSYIQTSMQSLVFNTTSPYE